MNPAHEKKDRSGNPYFVRVSVGLLDPQHRERMGAAIWLYLCLLDAQTDDQGQVLGGRPLDLDALVARSGIPRRTVQRHLRTLVDEDYLKAKSLPGGKFSLSILRPKRRRPAGGKPVDNSVPAGGQKLADAPVVAQGCATSATPSPPTPIINSSTTTLHKDTAEKLGAADAPRLDSPRMGKRQKNEALDRVWKDVLQPSLQRQPSPQQHRFARSTMRALARYANQHLDIPPDTYVVVVEQLVRLQESGGSPNPYAYLERAVPGVHVRLAEDRLASQAEADREASGTADPAQAARWVARMGRAAAMSCPLDSRGLWRREAILGDPRAK